MQTESEYEQLEELKPRKKLFKHIHDCEPINGACNIDYSGRKAHHATLKATVRKGMGLKTVILGSPVFKRRLNKRTRPFRILLDTGSDGDIAFLTRSEFLKFEAVRKSQPSRWTTSNGDFITNDVAKMDLLFPELSQSKIFSCKADVKIVSVNDNPTYDLIVGIETLARWNALLDFENRVLTLDGIQTPMKSNEELQSRRDLFNTYNEAMEPSSTKQATERVVKILDAKYEKADLPKVVEENCPNLTNSQKEALLKVLTRHESMFEGKLGTWDKEFVNFELKPGAKPFRGRAFPVPRIHRDTIKKELKRLIDIGCHRI